MLLKHAKRLAQLLIRRPKGWRSLVYNTAMAKARIIAPLMRPVHITIEPTNACNLRCPVCETGNGSMLRQTGFLDYDLYREFIDEIAPTTAVLMFYFMGEPFLHRRAYDMIRYARDHELYVETCTNGDLIDPEGVIYSDVNEIHIQIGGMTQRTHEIYRVRSSLDRITRNVERLLAQRHRHRQSNVKVCVGFIVMRHNEHEVAEFLQWARATGVDQANVIDPCVRTVEEGRMFLPSDRRYWFYDEKAFAQGFLKPKQVSHNECTWIWNALTVNWDGTVVPCCRDPNGRHYLGNVFEEKLGALWNGEAMRGFRRRILKEQAEVDICRLCSGFGVPKLIHSPPKGFEVERLSVNERKFDSALDSVPVTWHRAAPPSDRGG